jgi:polyphosphate kinase
MGFCPHPQYDEFMDQVPGFEAMLVSSGITLVKLWFSVSRREQLTRFTIRRIDPVRRWKLSPVDLDSLDRWEDYTVAKEEMFRQTHRPGAPWTVVRANDEKRGRLEAMRFVLSRIDYPERDPDLHLDPDP